MAKFLSSINLQVTTLPTVMIIILSVGLIGCAPAPGNVKDENPFDIYRIKGVSDKSESFVFSFATDPFNLRTQKY